KKFLEHWSPLERMTSSSFWTLLYPIFNIMAEKLTRREWGKLAAAGAAGLILPSIFTSCKTASAVVPLQLKGTAAAKAAKELGIILGIQTYSFRDRLLDDAVKVMQQLGVKSIELWEGHIEPLELQWNRADTREQRIK